MFQDEVWHKTWLWLWLETEKKQKYLDTHSAQNKEVEMVGN